MPDQFKSVWILSGYQLRGGLRRPPTEDTWETLQERLNEGYTFVSWQPVIDRIPPSERSMTDRSGVMQYDVFLLKKEATADEGSL